MAGRALSMAGAFFPAESYEVGAARLVRGQALLALGRGAEARADLEAVLDTFERVLGRDHPFLADPMTGLGEVALAERRPTDAQGSARTRLGDTFDPHRRRWRSRADRVQPGTAIWEASPADRRHALELAAEARDGYAALPDLATRLDRRRGWLSRRIAHEPRHVRARPRGRSAPPREAPPEDLEPAPL